MMLALGWHLADSTLFALLVGLACLCMRHRGPASRYTLWLIATAKFAVPTVAFIWLGESTRGLLPTSHVSVVPVVVSRWVIASPVSAAPKGASATWFDLLVIAWVIGSGVAFVLWLRNLLACRVSSASRDDSEPGWFSRLSERMGLQGIVRIAISEDVREPALAGFRRPAVMIPTELLRQLSAAELESVTLHELAHAKRGDNWTAAFAHAVTCVFWFYPPVWWIEKRLHTERELACDEMVIRSGATADDYFAGILKVCRFYLTREITGVASISGSNLKKRKEAMMLVSPNSPTKRLPKALVASLTAAVIGIPLAIGLVFASNVLANQKNAQSATELSKIQSPLTCVFQNIDYPEGTVIQQGNGPEQLCARTSRTSALMSWIPTSEVIRQRSATVVHVLTSPTPPLFYCSPTPPTAAGLCACENAGPFSSGALVNSANGPHQLRCENGDWVQTKQANAKRP